MPLCCDIHYRLRGGRIRLHRVHVFKGEVGYSAGTPWDESCSTQVCAHEDRDLPAACTMCLPLETLGDRRQGLNQVVRHESWLHTKSDERLSSRELVRCR